MIESYLTDPGAEIVLLDISSLHCLATVGHSRSMVGRRSVFR